MKKIENFETAQKAARYEGGQRLEPGAYEAKILDVKYINGENGNSDRIELAFDITEGDFIDHFRKLYESSTDENKKWKGKTTLYVPKGDGTEKDGWTAKTLARWTNAFEDSNEGYSWDWDESKWKGLKVGLIFGAVGNVIDGKEVTYTECRFPASIQKVKDGTCKIPDFKAKNGYTGNQTTASTDSNGFLTVSDSEEEEIPFL